MNVFGLGEGGGGGGEVRVGEGDDGREAEGAAEDGEGAGVQPDGAEVALGRDDGQFGVALGACLQVSSAVCRVRREVDAH